MKTKEIHVVFRCLDGTTELSRSDALEGIQRPNQPYCIQLVRILFEGCYIFQVDDELTLIQKDAFKITYLNDEPDNLVIHGDGKNPEPAGFEGTLEELLQEYKAPITLDDLIRMRTAYLKVILKLS